MRTIHSSFKLNGTTQAEWDLHLKQIEANGWDVSSYKTGSDSVDATRLETSEDREDRETYEEIRDANIGKFS